MKMKIKNYKPAIFFALYSVFTIICGYLSWMFSKLRILMFQIWYQVTAVIWFILSVTVIVLLIRLLRPNKPKNKIKHWKE
ncbi:MAG: conjugal transfer protein [Clostridium sp.]|nr:conjugal transfer protein [Clostridium sp.]